MAITIQDVAKRAGVGLGTVSRVVNGANHVRASTRARVEAAMRDLDYHPNPHASNLKRQSVKVIGFLMTSSLRRPSDPFFGALLSGIADAAGRQRYDLLVASIPDPADEIQRLAKFVSGNRVGGLILIDRRLEDLRIQWLQGKGIPFVSFGRIEDGGATPWLDVDSRLGVDRAVTHLIQNGHARIAFIGLPEDLLVSCDRLEGYRSALRRAGLGINEDYVVTECWNEADGQAAAEKLLALAERPTAIVASSDVIAFGVLHVLKMRGYTPGRDISVIGFDDVPMAAHTSPPLTTLQQPIYDIGAQLVDMLIQHIAGQPVISKWIEPKLIVRQTS